MLTGQTRSSVDGTWHSVGGARSTPADWLETYALRIACVLCTHACDGEAFISVGARVQHVLYQLWATRGQHVAGDELTTTVGGQPTGVYNDQQSTTGDVDVASRFSVPRLMCKCLLAFFKYVGLFA
jgi:hypothetical protein